MWVFIALLIPYSGLAALLLWALARAHAKTRSQVAPRYAVVKGFEPKTFSPAGECVGCHARWYGTLGAPPLDQCPRCGAEVE